MQGPGPRGGACGTAHVQVRTTTRSRPLGTQFRTSVGSYLGWGVPRETGT